MASCRNVMKTNLPSLSCRCAMKCELKKWLLAEPLVSIVTMFPECRRVPVFVVFLDHSLFQVGILRDGERQ